MASTVIDFVNNTLAWFTYALDAPSARAVVFGFNIGGNLLCSLLKFPSFFTLWMIIN
jgi:serine palmitoyltransferase